MEKIKNMGKFWCSCRSYVGLVFLFVFCFLHGSLKAELIWQSKDANEFSFAKYESFFCFIVLPIEIEQNIFVDLLKSYIPEKDIRKVDIENLEEVLFAMGNAKMLFNVFLQKTEDPNINILQVYVTASAQALYNRTSFSSSPWNREFLLKSQNSLTQDIQKALNLSFSDFFQQFYLTNPTAKEKAQFYIPVLKNI